MARIWATRLGAGALLLGVLLYGLMAYQVVAVGGPNVGSERLACSRAATGEETPGYRSDERVRIERSYLPPSATCHYSAGLSASLVRLDVFSWAGPALVVIGGLTLLVARKVDRRRPGQAMRAKHHG